VEGGLILGVQYFGGKTNELKNEAEKLRVTTLRVLET